MALTKNQYLTDAILNLLLGSPVHTPSSIHAVLTTVVPTRADTNGTLVRAAYPSYADALISGCWAAISESLTTGSSMITNLDIPFVSPSLAPGSPVIVVGFAIIDDANNILYQGPLNAPLSVATMGQIIKIPAGTLTITES